MGWFRSGQPDVRCALIHSPDQRQPPPPPRPPPPRPPPQGPPALHCPSLSKVQQACAPLFEKAIKSVCGGRRLLFSFFILLLIMAGIYWLSVTHQQTLTNEPPHSVIPVSSNQRERSKNEAKSSENSLDTVPREQSMSQQEPMYHNDVAQTSQIHILQQQQQPINQQQPMQSQEYYCCPPNQQGIYAQNQFGQPYQQDAYVGAQPQQQQHHRPILRSGVGNLGQPTGQTAYTVPPIMQSQAHDYGSLPAHILDQIRPYIGTSAPIFILPNNCPSPAVAAPQPAIAPTSLGQAYPGMTCPSTPIYCPPASCYPYPMAMPIFNPFTLPNQSNSKESTKNCGCCSKKIPGYSENHSNSTYYPTEPTDHHCVGGNDETICTKRNCPSSINLQALASQLLAIQGIIPCAATRLVLRRVAGSNITSSTEETIERAKRSLNTLTQEQLLSETRHAQQVNALINLHMTANPPPNVVPILTTVQLKVNLLKAHVDSSINQRLSESQGTEGSGRLDPLTLALKSDQELRDLLGTLRQKECEERVNLNFATYQSQRVIAESRLSSIQNKIAQIEFEVHRRRGAAQARPPVAQKFSDPGWYGYNADVSNTSSYGGAPVGSTQNYVSPDPFQFQVRSPKRLNLQPHVGSPETTYELPKKAPTAKPSKSRKDSDDEDGEEDTKNSARDPSSENHRCACEKSSEDDSADEGKKKLGAKILAGRDLDSMIEGDRHDQPGVSILKLSKNIVIVIDNPCDGLKKNEKKKEERVKSEEKTKSSEATDYEKTDETKAQISPDDGKVADDGDKTTGTIADKIWKFKWGKKKAKIDDQVVTEKVVETSQVEIKQEIKAEDNAIDQENEIDQETDHKIDHDHDHKVDHDHDHETDHKVDHDHDHETNRKIDHDSNHETDRPRVVVKQERVDYFRGSDGFAPVTEQTVRMITKIDYEPSVFRAFHNPVDEPPEKERVVEERFKGFFTEDSLKSTSIESTVDSRRTPESISFRVGEREEASTDSGQVPDVVQHVGEASRIEVLQRDDSVTNEEKMGEGSRRTMDKVRDSSRRIHRSGPSRHKDGNEDAVCEKGKCGKASLENKEEDNEDDSISGALTTVGNHVASFGSIIGKIAALKLHQMIASSQTLLSGNTTNQLKYVEPGTLKAGNEAGSSGTDRGKPTKSDAETNKNVGKWKYIKFADVNDTISASTTGESSNSESSYALPKIKHSVIEDTSNGSKYVVIEEPSKNLRRELGEPYRTGRSLVIRSRPKSPLSPPLEHPKPFTVVKGPKHTDNCLALHVASPKSPNNNRCQDFRDLKSSDKFWFRLESPEYEPVKSTEALESVAGGPETLKFPTDDTVSEKTWIAHSVSSINNEHIVQVHEYSKISATSTRTKLPSGSEKSDNGDATVSSIA